MTHSVGLFIVTVFLASPAWGTSQMPNFTQDILTAQQNCDPIAYDRIPWDPKAKPPLAFKRWSIVKNLHVSTSNDLLKNKDRPTHISTITLEGLAVLSCGADLETLPPSIKDGKRTIQVTLSMHGSRFEQVRLNYSTAPQLHYGDWMSFYADQGAWEERPPPGRDGLMCIGELEKIKLDINSFTALVCKGSNAKALERTKKTLIEALKGWSPGSLPAPSEP